MLRGVWVPCWRDVAGLAAPPFEDRGADSVSCITGVASWLLRGVCETARRLGTQPEHTHTLTARQEEKKWKKKNLQRGVLGQHRQVYSVLEFYSLQGVL